MAMKQKRPFTITWLWKANWLRNFLSDRGYYRIEDLQMGGRCGACGAWCSKEIVEKIWPYTVCDKCAGIYHINISGSGDRYVKDPNFDVDEFLRMIIEPPFLKAKAKDGTFHIDFDGGFGYSTKFLKEVFGKLAKKYGPDKVSSVLAFKSDDEPGLIAKVNEYIHNCHDEDYEK